MAIRLSQLEEDLAVGSCPRGFEDVDLLCSTWRVGALVSLQTDADLQRLGLSWSVLWQLYTARGILTARVPIVDFDKRDLLRHLDAAADAVATARQTCAPGRVTYVHCTAGLNRSPSACIAATAIARGVPLTEAMDAVLARHPSSQPYGKLLAKWAKRRGIPVTR